MYSKNQAMKALRVYRKCESATETIRTLGILVEQDCIDGLETWIPVNPHWFSTKYMV